MRRAHGAGRGRPNPGGGGSGSFLTGITGRCRRGGRVGEVSALPGLAPTGYACPGTRMRPRMSGTPVIPAAFSAGRIPGNPRAPDPPTLLPALHASRVGGQTGISRDYTASRPSPPRPGRKIPGRLECRGPGLQAPASLTSPHYCPTRKARLQIQENNAGGGDSVPSPHVCHLRVPRPQGDWCPDLPRTPVASGPFPPVWWPLPQR